MTPQELIKELGDALFQIERIADDDWGQRGGGSDLPAYLADEIAEIADEAQKKITAFQVDEGGAAA